MAAIIQLKELQARRAQEADDPIAEAADEVAAMLDGRRQSDGAA